MTTYIHTLHTPLSVTRISPTLRALKPICAPRPRLWARPVQPHTPPAHRALLPPLCATAHPFTKSLNHYPLRRAHEHEERHVESLLLASRGSIVSCLLAPVTPGLAVRLVRVSLDPFPGQGSSPGLSAARLCLDHGFNLPPRPYPAGPRFSRSAGGGPPLLPWSYHLPLPLPPPPPLPPLPLPPDLCCHWPL